MRIQIIANIIFVIALIFISIGVTRSEAMLNQPKETIKFIPRSLEEEQREPVSIGKIFKSMFDQQTPWIGSFYDANVFERRVLDKERGLLNKQSTKQSDKQSEKKSYNPNVFSR